MMFSIAIKSAVKAERTYCLSPSVPDLYRLKKKAAWMSVKCLKKVTVFGSCGLITLNI